MLISVIVCTYNRADILKYCLESLGKQTVEKRIFEVIIIDNNSMDNTREVAESFVKQYRNCRYIRELKQGLSHARNRGYLEAKGKYVAYIDDDSQADSSWIENICSFVRRKSNIIAFGGPYSRWSIKELPQWFKESYETMNLGQEERQIGPAEWLSGTNMIYKKSILHELGGFNTNIGMSGNKISYGEETNLLMKIKSRNLPIYYVPDIIVEHLVADYKMSLTWILKSHYINGKDAIENYCLKKRPIKHILITMLLLLKGIFIFIVSRDKYIQNRIIGSFSHFIWNLGFSISMIRK